MSTYHLLKTVRITDVSSLYSNFIFLHHFNLLWHMDDRPHDVFLELPKETVNRLAQIQDEAWDVCQRDGICIHGVCLDIINAGS